MGFTFGKSRLSICLVAMEVVMGELAQSLYELLIKMLEVKKPKSTITTQIHFTGRDLEEAIWARPWIVEVSRNSCRGFIFLHTC